MPAGGSCPPHQKPPLAKIETIKIADIEELKIFLLSDFGGLVYPFQYVGGEVRNGFIGDVNILICGRNVQTYFGPKYGQTLGAKYADVPISGTNIPPVQLDFLDLRWLQ